MFANAFQKGDKGIEIFSPSGTDPLKHIALKNDDAIDKTYDRFVKGNILTLNQTSVSSSISCPRSSSKLLGIFQPWFCLQLNISSGKSFSMELIVSEQNERHHRIHFSTNFRGWDANELHARIAWPKVHEDMWVTYMLNLDDLCRSCFRSSFRSLDHFTVYSCCRIRKIFSLPLRTSDIIIPPNLDFPSGVSAEIFLVTLPDRVDKSAATATGPGTKLGKLKKMEGLNTNEIGIVGTKKQITAAVTAAVAAAVNTGQIARSGAESKSTAANSNVSRMQQQQQKQQAHHSEDKNPGSKSEATMPHFEVAESKLLPLLNQRYSADHKKAGVPALDSRKRIESISYDDEEDLVESRKDQLLAVDSKDDDQFVCNTLQPKSYVITSTSDSSQHPIVASNSIPPEVEGNECSDAVQLQRLLEDRNPWQTIPSPVKSFTRSPVANMSPSVAAAYGSLPARSSTDRHSRPASARVAEMTDAWLASKVDARNSSSMERKLDSMQTEQNPIDEPEDHEAVLEDEDIDEDNDDWHMRHTASKQELLALLQQSTEPLDSVLHNHPPASALTRSNELRSSVRLTARLQASTLVAEEAAWPQRRLVPSEPVDTQVFTSISQWQDAISKLLPATVSADHAAEQESDVPVHRVMCDTLQRLECEYWQAFGRQEYEQDIGFFRFEG